MSEAMRPADETRPDPAETAPAGPAEDEFSAFLSDIALTVSEVIDEAPWRRRLAAAILRWEGAGVRTRRLEQALDGDAPVDADALVAGFERDAARLAELAAELRALGAAPAGLPLDDPDRLAELEARLAEARAAADAAPRAVPAGEGDAWFRNPEKLAWDWVALEDRLAEELG